MKTTHRCPKCGHDHILYIAQVADRIGDHSQTEYGVPMKIAHYQKKVGELLGIAMTRTERAGELEAGVCKQCGYVELYVKNPADVIIDGVAVRELVATK